MMRLLRVIRNCVVLGACILSFGKVLKNGIILAVSAALMFSSLFAAYADEQEIQEEAAQEETTVSIDPAALREIVEETAQKYRFSTSDISIAYYYTGTGEEWYYNEDTWYYSASLYKVPMTMIYAEKEAAGEISQDTPIGGLKYSEALRLILENSNNEWAHVLMDNAGGDYACRQIEKTYSGLPDSYFIDDYNFYSYFTARFMLGVMKTLYSEPERFPAITEHLLKACPGEYFKDRLEDRYEIAQKYGSYEDSYGDIFNHTAGIVYTDNPFILVVMTKNAGQTDEVISYISEKFAGYTQSLDDIFAEIERARAEAERIEAERIAAEEAARQAEEAERLEQERMEQERLEQERLEQERLEQERMEQERLEQERAEEEELRRQQRELEREQMLSDCTVPGVICAVLLVCIICVLLIRKRVLR